MIINIIGDCDKRPVLYTVMKICQSLGDVLLVSSSSRLMRLSDTQASYGHYQNCMVTVTQEGIDDFFDNFEYDLADFEFVIIDNIISADADIYIYVEGMTQSENELDMLEYIEEYETIKLYKGHLIDGKTLYHLEEFEALKNMCPIGTSIASRVAQILAPKFAPSKANKETTKKYVENFTKIAMAQNPTPDTESRKNKSILNKIKR